MRLKEKDRTVPVVDAIAEPASTTARGAAFKIGDGASFLPEAVQSNVIRSVNPQQARYVFFQIADPDAFRRFIGNLLDPTKGDPNGEDSDFLDLVEEAHLTFEGKSDGEIAFGALNSRRPLRRARRFGLRGVLMRRARRE